MGTTEDETVVWHHWLNGHEFEQTPGVCDGHGGLLCYSPWGLKELDTTEQLNWTELVVYNNIHLLIHSFSISPWFINCKCRLVLIWTDKNTISISSDFYFFHALVALTLKYTFPHPVFRTRQFRCHGPGFKTWRGNYPQATWRSQKIKINICP